jgi:hypothetical protein
VPARARDADRHAHAAALGRRIAVVAIVAFPASTERYVTDEKTFNWTIGAMLVVAGSCRASRCRSRRDRGRVHHRHGLSPDSEVRETMRSFFGVHKITETSTALPCVPARHHDPRRRAAARRQGEPITGKPPMITYYHPNSPMGHDGKGRAGAR